MRWWEDRWFWAWMVWVASYFVLGFYEVGRCTGYFG